MPLSGGLQRTINNLTRLVTGTGQVLSGSVTRVINLLTRATSGTAQIFSGVAQGVKGAVSTASAAITVFSGTLTRIADLKRAPEGVGQIFSGVASRVINLLTRPVAGVGQIFTGAALRVLDLARSPSGIAQIFTGAVDGVKTAATNAYTATGMARMVGAITRVFSITRAYAGTLRATGSLQRLFSITRPVSGAMSVWTGIVSSATAEGGTLRKGYLRMTGAVIRILGMYRLSTASVGMSGTVTKSLLIFRTLDSTMRFTQGDYGTDSWKEEMYYGVRNP